MKGPDFDLKLDLQATLALFLLVRERKASANPDLEQLESGLRAFLYERLSIAEMEKPELLYDSMRARRDRRISDS